MMSRKDYILIAAALRSANLAVTNSQERDGISKAVVYLTMALSSDNPRFDDTKFIKAVTKP